MRKRFFLCGLNTIAATAFEAPLRKADYDPIIIVGSVDLKAEWLTAPIDAILLDADHASDSLSLALTIAHDSQCIALFVLVESEARLFYLLRQHDLEETKGTVPSVRSPVLAGHFIKPVVVESVITAYEAAAHLTYQGSRGILNIAEHRFLPHRALLQRKDGNEIALTRKEVDLLRLLHHRGDRGASRQDLLAYTWDYNTEIMTHTLETHIYRLRRKLEPSLDKPSPIRFHDGFYRLASSKLAD